MTEPEQGVSEQEQSEFAQLTLDGSRFRAPGLPAESAGEIANYRAAILDVAKRLWRDDNPGRNFPTAYKNALDLRLVALRPGSSIMGFRLSRSASQSPDVMDEIEALFGRARDALSEAVEAVDTQQELPSSFPVESMPALRKLGVTLGDGDTLGIGSRTRGRTATVTTRTRAILAEIDAVLDEPVHVELTAEGVIYEFDGANASFELRNADGLKVICHLPPEAEALARAAKDACAPDGVTAPDVRVRGHGLPQPGRELWEVFSVEPIRSYAGKVLASRLDALRALEPGWWGPGSLAPEPLLLDRVAGLESVLEHLDVPVHIGPDHDGGTVLEWRRDDIEYTAQLDTDGTVLFVVDNTATDVLDETRVAQDDGLLTRFLQVGTWP